MPGRNFLFIPGSTNVPRRLQNAINLEQEDMRALDLPEFTKPLYADMKIARSQDSWRTCRTNYLNNIDNKEE